MPFEHAMTALDCLTGHGLDPAWPVWTTFALCVLVVLQYVRIAVRWFGAFSHSRIAVSLIAIFLLCAFCGYGSFCLSMWWPAVAYTLRLVLLITLVVSNEAFLVVSHRKKFEIEAGDQRLGERIRAHSLHLPADERERVVDCVLTEMSVRLRDTIKNGNA